MNITLREVAKQLNKSYGNITYHYSTKEALLNELFEEMHAELSALQAPNPETNLLIYLLNLPAISYEITLKYLFFSLDTIEIKRNFNDLFQRFNAQTDLRKARWLQLLELLRHQGYFRDSVTTQDLNYLMFLSGSSRTAYFFVTEEQAYNKADFVKLVNLLLKPYLSESGLALYQQYNAETGT